MATTTSTSTSCNQHNSSRSLGASLEEEEEFMEENPLSQQDFLNVLDGATTLMRHVESAFREVGQEDADEIADVTLTLAQLFLISLQSLHATLTPESLLEAARSTTQQSQQSQSQSQKKPGTLFLEINIYGCQRHSHHSEWMGGNQSGCHVTAKVPL
jgi:hypothetical protein